MRYNETHYKGFIRGWGWGKMDCAIGLLETSSGEERVGSVWNLLLHAYMGLHSSATHAHRLHRPQVSGVIKHSAWTAHAWSYS